MQAWPVYFVDNVITTGATVSACRRALGWGSALTYADAGTWRNTRPRSTGRMILPAGLRRSLRSNRPNSHPHGGRLAKPDRHVH